MKKVGKESKRGGHRKGSGRPPGTTKRKISVSVDQENFDLAIKKWGDKPSKLIDSLIKDYVSMTDER